MADIGGSQLPARSADLVLEGGGVKGIALVGALEVLEENGYTFRRVAGSSAGAIAGALVAAGIPTKQMVEILRNTDYRKFMDGGRFSNILVGKAIDLWVHNGLYHGEYLKKWLDEQLRTYAAGAGPNWPGTFADLPYEDPDPEKVLPEARRFRLMVTGSDLTNGRLRYFPWDFGDYGLDPGSQRIVDAVRVSMSIPFFYRPVKWRQTDGTVTWLVDGGMLSNYPISVFDAPMGVAPRWPTIGVKLSGRPQAGLGIKNEIKGPVGLARAMLRTMMGFYDGQHIDASDAIDRTIFVDTGGIRTTQFDLGPEDREMLYQNGREAAKKFLFGSDERPAWDFDAYIAKHRQVVTS